MKKSYNRLKASFFIVLGILSFTAATEQVQAQFSLGVDYNSRFVWRGFDFGNSPSIQPEITFTYGGLEVGAWAAYATNGNPAGSEIDFFASYTFETGAGDFSLSLTSYTFPDDPVDYFSSDAHFLELGLGYSTALTESWGLYLQGGMFVHNDDDNSVYGEIGFEYEAADYTLALFTGFSPKESADYGNSKFAFINTGLTLGKELKITESFSLDLSSSIIANPHARTAFFVFGFGFSL